MGPSYRMRELCERTGLSRHTIHYYIREGLLPPGERRTRTSALYGEKHVERLLLIRRLQEEQFLPLKAIKATLRGRDRHLTGPQQRLVDAVRAKLSPQLVERRSSTVAVAGVLQRTGVDRADFDAMVELGLLTAREDARGRLRIAADDAWLIEVWGGLVRAGLTRELGFEPGHLLLVLEPIDRLVEQEVALVTQRLGALSAERTIEIVMSVLPLVDTLMTRHHDARVRAFLTQL